jgi:hypothetical protein
MRTDLPMTPRDFIDSILRDHDARVESTNDDWQWGDDPTWAGVVMLAIIASRRSFTSADEFEAWLERLRHTPTGTARPAAERLLKLWRDRQGED